MTDFIQDIQNLKPKYRNGLDKIGEDFVNPCLKACTFWRRTTLGFSSSTLKSWGGSFVNILKEVEKIEILADISQFSEKDRTLMRALEHNANSSEKNKTLVRHAENILLTALSADKSSSVTRDHIWALLHYFLASEKLEIRFAINKISSNPKNLYHEKSGYFNFPDGESIAHSGSFNESDSGYQYNNESVKIFWKSKEQVIQDLIGHPDDYNNFKSTKRDVDADWNGSEWVEVHKLSKETLKRIKENAPQSYPPPPSKEPDNNPIQRNIPLIPESFNGKPFKLNKHQDRALDLWAHDDYSGILEHATGSGKTVTAIVGACKLAKDSKKILVVTVPYQSLGDQWIDELINFNIFATKCFESAANWENVGQQAFSKWRNKSKEVSYIQAYVVVNRTLSTDKFQSFINSFPKEDTIIIGDECHRYAKMSGTQYLPKGRYRLGLSATPFRDGDDFGNAELLSFFGKIIDSYTLSDALADDVLTPYNYIPQKIYLTDDEYELFLAKAKLAGQFYNKDDYGQISTSAQAAIGAMNRIKGSAENKFIQLQKLIPKLDKYKQAILFCGDGSTDDDETIDGDDQIRDIEQASIILDENDWISCQFTCKEKTHQRHQILKDFKNENINALVSIRVLDEGIDIPGVGIALLIASSRNKRQYVQRRGRVLRKSDNKDKAFIYDFICLPPKELSQGSTLVDGEFERLIEMYKDCDNKQECVNFIEDLSTTYHLSEDLIEYWSDLKNAK